MRVGRLINVPRFITGAVFETPIKKLRMGICINAPPPPLMVDKVNAAAPKKKSASRSQMGISVKSVSIKNPATCGMKSTVVFSYKFGIESSWPGWIMSGLSNLSRLASKMALYFIGSL